MLAAVATHHAGMFQCISQDQASLLSAEVGFDALYFARLDYQDRDKRRQDKSMEMVSLSLALPPFYTPPPPGCRGLSLVTLLHPPPPGCRGLSLVTLQHPTPAWRVLSPLCMLSSLRMTALTHRDIVISLSTLLSYNYFMHV